MTSKLDTAGLVERLRGYEDCCPFCGHDPYHYVDNGVGMERVAVTCCGLGIALFQHGDEQLQEELDLRREAADLIEALTQAAAPDMARAPDEEITPEVWSFVQSQFVRPTTDRSFYTFVALLVTRHRSQLSALQERAERAETRVEQLENSEEWQRLTTALEAAEARVAELEGRPDENGFIISHPVEKFTGEARWEGTLVASYLTTAGKRRYVVEVHPQGFQMIAVPAQLRMIAALTDDRASAALAHKGEGR